MVRGYAALPAQDGESVFDWIRRQNNPVKPSTTHTKKKAPAAAATAGEGTTPQEGINS